MWIVYYQNTPRRPTHPNRVGNSSCVLDRIYYAFWYTVEMYSTSTVSFSLIKNAPRCVHSFSNGNSQLLSKWMAFTKINWVPSFTVRQYRIVNGFVCRFLNNLIDPCTVIPVPKMEIFNSWHEFCIGNLLKVSVDFTLWLHINLICSGKSVIVFCYLWIKFLKLICNDCVVDA